MNDGGYSMNCASETALTTDRKRVPKVMGQRDFCGVTTFLTYVAQTSGVQPKACQMEGYHVSH